VELLSEGAALDELEDEVKPAIHFDGIMGFHDVRVLKTAQDSGLQMETGPVIWFYCAGLNPGFEGHNAIKTNLTSFVDNTQSAAAYLFQDLVKSAGGPIPWNQRNGFVGLRPGRAIKDFRIWEVPGDRALGPGSGPAKGANNPTVCGQKPALDPQVPSMALGANKNPVHGEPSEPEPKKQAASVSHIRKGNQATAEEIHSPAGIPRLGFLLAFGPALV
jgi:hypothetical protein